MPYPTESYEPEYKQKDDMEEVYKLAEAYKPEEEEYKMENYKEMSSYPEEKPEKYSMDDYKDMKEYKKEKKYKPSKEMEYKIEEDDSKYGKSDEGKYDDEEDSKYKPSSYDSYKEKDDSEYASKEDSYSSQQPPTTYSSDDFYKQEDDYKPTRDERKYSPSEESSGNPYRSMTTSHKNLNSGQQDYITLVGKQFTIKPRYNSVPPSTLPPHAQPNKPQSSNNNNYNNNNNDYPSSIQQQIHQINSKSSSRYPSPSSHQRQSNENFDQPPPQPSYQKPAAQSYPVPARAQSYPPQRQHSGYPPPPVNTLKTMQYASEPVQQEYEEDPPSYPATKKKARRPVYDDEEEEYERPRPARKSRKSRKMRRPERYEDEEERYPSSKSRRRRPAEMYEEEEEYEAPRPKSKKRKGSQYAASQDTPSYEVRESLDQYIRSASAAGSGSGNRYEPAGSSPAFSFATTPPDFMKTLLGEEDAHPELIRNLPSPVSAIARRDSVDEETESPDSRPTPAAESFPTTAQALEEVEHKLDPAIDYAASASAVAPFIERKEAKVMLPNGQVVHSIKKAIIEAVGRNQEVYDAIGSSRLMNKYDELLSSVEAANYPHPYYSQSNPYNPLATAPPQLVPEEEE